LPPKPDYLRVKVRRRLKGIGAVPVKHTVYLLANTSEALEDFHWLREEIEAEGGSAIIAEATFVEGLSDEEVEAMLETERGETIDADSERRVGAEKVEAGQTWVTRRDVHVDRIASAWLIRRFIDRDAALQVRCVARLQTGCIGVPLRHVRGGIHARWRGVHVSNVVQKIWHQRPRHHGDWRDRSRHSIARTSALAGPRRRASRV